MKEQLFEAIPAATIETPVSLEKITEVFRKESEMLEEKNTLMQAANAA